MLYIVPSRGRPDNIRALIESFAHTRTFVNLWVCVDDDDPKREEYESIQRPEWASLFIAPRKRLGPTLNDYAFMYSSMPRGDVSPFHAGIVGFMGDDHRPRTRGWDIQIAEAAELNGGTAVVYGNDLVHGARLPTAVAMTTDIVRSLGYFCPPKCTHLYLDNAWHDIGTQVGKLIYLQNTIIEHCHPIANKGVEWDETYKEVNSGEMYAADQAAYQEWAAQTDWRERLASIA